MNKSGFHRNFRWIPVSLLAGGKRLRPYLVEGPSEAPQLAAGSFTLRAFELGAPIVLVTGCHPADCHYINANSWTQKRVDRLREKLGKLGIRPERLQLEWVSAAEGQKWARVMTGVEEMRKKVTAEEIEHAKRVLPEDRQKETVSKRSRK